MVVITEVYIHRSLERGGRVYHIAPRAWGRPGWVRGRRGESLTHSRCFPQERQGRARENSLGLTNLNTVGRLWGIGTSLFFWYQAEMTRTEYCLFKCKSQKEWVVPIRGYELFNLHMKRMAPMNILLLDRGRVMRGGRSVRKFPAFHVCEDDDLKTNVMTGEVLYHKVQTTIDQIGRVIKLAQKYRYGCNGFIV